jgi:ornithine carbamoyltransferase
MPNNLHGRSLLTLEDYTREEIALMIAMAKDYKQMKNAGIPHATLRGKSVALLFEKPSTRTRAAFEVAAADLGMHPVYLGPGDMHLGKEESNEDTAKILGRIFDGIEYRGFAHQTAVDLAEHSGVPVWNGLTDLFHPTQVLADFMTIEEQVGKPLHRVKLVYVGDGRNNTANSLMIGSAKMGIDFTIASPTELRPSEELINKARDFAEGSGAQVNFSDDLYGAVDGVDVLYTDVWASMGEEDEFENRINLLRGFQIHQGVIEATHNPDVIFLHCLPAFHDINTAIGERIKEQYGLDAMEVTDEVFCGPHSRVFDLAENRLHTIKSVMALTL